MNVLIIREDSRKDKYILKPLFERLFRSLGKPSARVRVCEDPVLGGVSEALKSIHLSDVVERYKGMTDCFVLCVDRDGVVGRRERLREIEAEFTGQTFLAENAWEELETWTLAGLKLPGDWHWSDVRAEISVKEQYFDVIARRRNLAHLPGGGRRELGEEAARQIPTIRRKCREDFDNLARRIEKVTTTG